MVRLPLSSANVEQLACVVTFWVFPWTLDMHGISCCVACTSNDYMMLGAWPYGANSHVMTCLRSLVVKNHHFLTYINTCQLLIFYCSRIFFLILHMLFLVGDGVIMALSRGIMKELLCKLGSFNGWHGQLT